MILNIQEQKRNLIDNDSVITVAPYLHFITAAQMGLMLRKMSIWLLFPVEIFSLFRGDDNLIDNSAFSVGEKDFLFPSLNFTFTLVCVSVCECVCACQQVCAGVCAVYVNLSETALRVLLEAGLLLQSQSPGVILEHVLYHALHSGPGSQALLQKTLTIISTLCFFLITTQLFAMRKSIRSRPKQQAVWKHLRFIDN